MSNIKASIITIGDELLIGQTIDTNSAWIGQQLNKLGIDVYRRVAVGDVKDSIVAALDEEKRKSSLVLITGGLGPTADDITKPLLCEYFGGRMVVDEKVLAHVQEIFRVRNRPFLERNLKQAEVPDVCTVLFNRMGTAPGMWFEQEGTIFVSMPGVPFEMMAIMEDEVLPRLQQLLISDAIVHRSVITAGEGESFIAEQISDIETALPAHIKLAYLPHAGGVRLRLTGKAGDEAALVAELDSWQNQLATRLAKITIATEDIPIEQIVGNLLLQRGQTISLAESCTGGYVAHLLTQVPGASAYFMGSVVCYDYAVKENLLHVRKETLETQGAVSEATVLEMAANVRSIMNTDYSVAISGILGPGGGTPDKPVGTVWMAVADRERTIAKKFRFHYDRIRNKEMAANTALLMVLRLMKGEL